MANDLEQVLRKSGYSALPLPRGKTGPTAIYSFRQGQLYIVRNPRTCLPLEVTSETSTDLVQYTREYKFNLSGVAGFILRTLGIGQAKSELEIHSIKSATVQMGGPTHETIETGALIDYMLAIQPSPCQRDLLDPDNLTIVAALKAASFTFTFRTEKGVAVKLSGEEATGLFRADASVGVEVTQSGQVVVNAPSYVGVVSWNGSTMKREVEKARKYATRKVAKAFAGPEGLRRYEAPAVMSVALTPDEVTAIRLKSLGIAAAPGEKAAPKRGKATPRRKPAPKRGKSPARRVRRP